MNGDQVAVTIGAMGWSTHLDPDSVFLAQEENVMVYGTPDSIAVLQFSGDDVNITTYPDAVAFSEAMKAKHAGLVTRVLTTSRLIASPAPSILR